MSKDISHAERIKRMLAQGKLSAEEAERLSASLDEQRDRDRELAEQFAKRPDPSAGRLRIWLMSCAVFLVLGVLAGAYVFSAGSISPQVPERVVEESSQSAVPQRMIDLKQLDMERSSTMTKSVILSLFLIVVLVLAVAGGTAAFIYNGLVTSRENVNGGWAQVENAYQRRLDLVPLLVDAVQEYVEHENETLVALSEARAQAQGANQALKGGVPASAEQLRVLEAAQGNLMSAMTRLMAVVENYPDLKASQNFLSLQDQIEGTENRVAVERNRYNELVRHYNSKIQRFPSNIFAQAFGFDGKPYFQAESSALQGLKDPFERDAK